MFGSIRNFLSVLSLMVLFLAAPGCMRNIYVVPNALTEQYAAKAPLTVGLLMVPELRQQWFKWKSESRRKRVDIPVGKLALDFARAGMREAFQDFYVERYYDRRSEKGLLVIIRRLDFSLQGNEVVLITDVSIEDESRSQVFAKTYRIRGKSARRAIIRVPFRGKIAEKVIEANTREAFEETYKQLVLDIYVLVGVTKPVPQDPLFEMPESEEELEEPAETDTGSETPEPAEADESAAPDTVTEDDPPEDEAAAESDEPAPVPPAGMATGEDNIPRPWQEED